MSLIGEQQDSWIFGCYACGCARVVSKPQTIAAARHMIQMQRRAVAATLDRSQGVRKRFVFLGGTT